MSLIIIKGSNPLKIKKKKNWDEEKKTEPTLSDEEILKHY